MLLQSFCERDRDRKIYIALFETEVLLMLRYSSEYNSVKGESRTCDVASGGLLTDSEVDDGSISSDGDAKDSSIMSSMFGQVKSSSPAGSHRWFGSAIGPLEECFSLGN